VSTPLLIAIIDDDASVRTATASLVRSLGLEVATFASGQAFLDAPRRSDAACVITDVQMPGMSGPDLQAHLHATGLFLPMIFITAFPEERVRRQVIAAGAAGFFAKPFDGNEMIACIERVLEASPDAAGFA